MAGAEDIEHARAAVTYARRLADHVTGLSDTLDALAGATWDTHDTQCAYLTLGARALADHLLEHLDGLEAVVRAADEAQKGPTR